MKTLVFDIGGTFIKYGVFTADSLGEVEEIPTKAYKGGRHVLDTIIDLIEKAGEYDAIGISTAGQVDTLNGSIRYANQNIPGYTGMQIRRELEERFHVPVMVENDVNSAAVGEAVCGAGKGRDSFICITYGTGIGGAVIENGNVYHGASFSAGEFGAIVTHSQEKIHGNDPFDGCYEKYASTTALVKKAQKYKEELKDGRSIFVMFSDEHVQKIVEEWIDEILVGLSTVIHIFNPKCIVLGGGIMKQQYIIDQIRKRIGSYIMPSFSNVEIVAAELGNNAGLYGIHHLAGEYVMSLG